MIIKKNKKLIEKAWISIIQPTQWSNPMLEENNS